MDSGEGFRALLAGNRETGQEGMLDKLGLSVEKFSLACGVTRTSVYFYLSGKSIPSSKTLHKMAHVLGIPSEKLFATLPTREPGGQPFRRNHSATQPHR
jgi:transcriptional regulator with XRE-family HTH domain